MLIENLIFFTSNDKKTIILKHIPTQVVFTAKRLDFKNDYEARRHCINTMIADVKLMPELFRESLKEFHTRGL